MCASFAGRHTTLVDHLTQNIFDAVLVKAYERYDFIFMIT